MKRLLILLLVAGLLCSCAQKPAETQNNTVIPGVTGVAGKTPATGLFNYGQNSISGGIFLFLLAQSKSAYLYSATGDTQDDAQLWTQQGDDGQTVGQTLFDEVVDSVLSILYYADQAEKLSISLTDEEDTEIISTLDSMVNSYGGQVNFNNAMLRVGASYSSLRDFYRLEKLAQKGADAVLAEDGSDPITHEQLMQYYLSNFITLRHIYFNTAYDDPTTGQALTEAQKQQKSQRADEILRLVNDEGHALSEYKDESEDGIINDNPDGVTIPLDSRLLSMYASSGTENNVFYNYYFLFNKLRGFAEAALTHDSGVVTRVDNEGVGIFLVERTPLILSMFDQYSDVIREFVLRPQRMSQTVKDLREKGEFTIDEPALATYNISSAPVLEPVQSVGE